MLPVNVLQTNKKFTPFWNSYFKNTQEPIVLVTPEMRIQEVNKAFCGFFEFSTSPLLFSEVTEKFPSNSNQFKEVLDGIINGEDNQSMQLEYTTSDQSNIFIELNFFATRQDDIFLGFLMTTKRVEKGPFGKGCTVLQSIYKNHPMGLMIIKTDNTIQSNHYFQEMLGYPHEDLKTFKIEDIIHVDDIEKLSEALKELGDGNINRSRIEQRYIRKDGSIFWMEVVLSNINIGKGGEVVQIAMLEDISDQKEVKEELKIREDLLHSVVNTALDGVIILDFELKILDWNRQATTIFGYRKEEVLNKPLLDLIAPPETKETYSQYWKSYMYSKKAQLKDKRIETECININKVRFPAEFSVTPIEINGTTFFSVFVRDITSRKTSENALHAQLIKLDEKNKQLKKYASSNSQLENFAYVASHDLKEPLRTIGNFVQLLEKRLANKVDDTDREFIQFIVGGVQNMNNLIDDLLTYSRVNTQEHVLKEMAPEDTLFVVMNGLNKVINETKSVIEFENLPPKIIANSTKLRQLFQNLIANAIKFRKKDSPAHIVISGEDQEDYWKFSVADNGIGIKDEFFSKIFDLFKKLHSKSDYQGSGIGLAVCKRIVEQHGGEIWVESTYQEGTTFHFTIAKEGVNS